MSSTLFDLPHVSTYRMTAMVDSGVTSVGTDVTALAAQVARALRPPVATASWVPSHILPHRLDVGGVTYGDIYTSMTGGSEYIGRVQLERIA
jgi:hypothetical protein